MGNRRRWSPRGNGIIKIIDYADTGVWVAPRGPGQGVEVIVYSGNNWHLDYPKITRGVVWWVRLPAGSPLLWHIYDKPRRVMWACDYAEDFSSHDLPVARRRRGRRQRWRNPYDIPRIARAMAPRSKVALPDVVIDRVATSILAALDPLEAFP